jgi:hypothetical protein
MYGWLWHRLPGGPTVRTSTMTVLILAAIAVLWFVVFPWASVHLPIDMSGVD